MKLSAKGEYACLALIYLTEQYTDGAWNPKAEKMKRREAGIMLLCEYQTSLKRSAFPQNIWSRF